MLTGGLGTRDRQVGDHSGSYGLNHYASSYMQRQRGRRGYVSNRSNAEDWKTVVTSFDTLPLLTSLYCNLASLGNKSKSQRQIPIYSTKYSSLCSKIRYTR